jgi:predicted TIM-barrel fold metal-dependent hydrolase
MRRLIDKGRTWVKLSGAYHGNVTIGTDGAVSVADATNYSAATKVAQAFVNAAPERLVWGSDWPHPGHGVDAKPNDAVLFDLLQEWAPTEAIRHRILVDNPQTLYGFPQV